MWNCQGKNNQNLCYLKGDKIKTDDVIVIATKLRSLEYIKNQLEEIRIEYRQSLEEKCLLPVEQILD